MLAISCKKNEAEINVSNYDTVRDEYADWYTLKAPIDHQIVGVWGNYNRTLLISTMWKVFRSTDQGKHWKEVHQQSVGIHGFVQYQDTLFAMSGLAGQLSKEFYHQLLIHPDNYSVDDGKTWQRYTRRNPLLSDMPNVESVDKRMLINPVKTSGGISYRINQVYQDGANATTGQFYTPGVISSNGRRIDLPQLHQLQSLYLDDQQRIYVAGTDAVCDRGYSGLPFGFCNSINGRGVVYVSKKPLP